MWPWLLLFSVPDAATQQAFLVMCASQVWLKFVRWFLRYIAKSDFCDLFWCYVTLTFDLLTHKVDPFMPLPCSLLVPFSIEIVYRQNVVLISLVTDGWTDEQTGRQLVLPTTLDWWAHNNHLRAIRQRSNVIMSTKCTVCLKKCPAFEWL